MTNVTQVHRVFIKASPEQVWEAITDPKWNIRYGYQCQSDYELRPGGSYRVLANDAMRSGGGIDVIIDGEVLESDPPRKLVQTWRALFTPETTAEGFSRLTWEIKEEYGATRLTLTQQFVDAPLAAEQTAGDLENAGGGWPYILSDLKTLLETGAPFSG
jgi:uncharacterized protein YndB with AHSA1/START domain